MVPTTRRESIKVQAKRLRDLFDIDLTTAKYVLARGPYGCADWADLCTRLDQESPLQGPLQLAELPQSQSATAYLAKHLCPLAASVSQLIITNRNLPSLCEALRQVFAVPGNPVALPDVLQALTPSEWLPTDLGQDPVAVIQSRVCVNGVNLLLLGTRIFWPRLFTFDAEITVEPVTAEPFGDGLKIMWEVAPWYQASRDYLFEYQRGDDWDDLPDFVEPLIPECARMQQHARWFTQCLKGWSLERHYNDEGEEFIPFLYQGHAYLVFGVPCAEPVMHPPLRRQYIQFPDEDSNRYQVILLGGQLLQIEMLIVPKPVQYQDWDYADYHQALCNGLLGGAAAAGWISAPLHGWGDLLFISPACRFILECQLRVEIKPEPNETLLTLQTDNPDLAMEVLERVHKGDFIRYEHATFGAHYAMRIDLPADHASVDLSLSMNCIEQTVFHSAHLITRRVIQSDRDKQTLYCDIEPALLKLVERQSLKLLKKAIREGQVLRVQGLSEQLQAAPTLQASGSTFDSTSNGVANPLEESLFNGDEELSFHSIRYQRSNF
ncbi:hypothetical protein [Pseudomonas fluorescens]|uniref:hypothetical protein n=1 Tax=Pseudomonas fluorescens TaxID=294 RepID=UPI0010D84AF7|nr:hypothetical protein [Pseudomonas fluorescens]TCV62211.1 hypothetical protein EDB98_113138 [Pseudomonas fluorescens]